MPKPQGATVPVHRARSASSSAAGGTSRPSVKCRLGQVGRISGSAPRSPPVRRGWIDAVANTPGQRARARAVGGVSSGRAVVGRVPERHASSAGVPRETPSPVGRARPEAARAAMMVPMDEVLIEGTDPRVREYLGDAYPRIARFAEMLVAEGVTRGLIGPREVPRLWARHLLNSAAVASLLPADGTLVDVGSGAGLPGIVLACMRAGGDMVLLEPMERRATWLQEVVDRKSVV